jgi:hypothetical protein
METIVRPVKGFERPLIQWMVVAGCVLLVAILASATFSVRRTTAQVGELVESQRVCRSEQDVLHAQLAKERAAREAFSLELARVRAQQGTDDTTPAETPTLTLAPPKDRGAVPPGESLTAPERGQTIQLRLLLPPNVTVKNGGFQVAARDWSTGLALWSTAAATTATVDGRRAVIAHVTGEMLRPGSYEVTVTGARSADEAPEPIAVYEVTIGG